MNFLFVTDSLQMFNNIKLNKNRAIKRKQKMIAVFFLLLID